MLRSAYVEIEDWRSEEQFDGLEAFSVDKKLRGPERELSRTNQLLLDAEQRNRVSKAAIQEKGNQLQETERMLAGKTDALEDTTQKIASLQEKGTRAAQQRVRYTVTREGKTRSDSERFERQD